MNTTPLIPTENFVVVDPVVHDFIRGKRKVLDWSPLDSFFVGLVALFFMGFCFLLLVDFHREFYNFYLLEDHGVVVEAQVTKKVGRTAKVLPIIYYEFEVQSHQYEGSEGVYDDNFEKIQVGEIILIRYLPENPTISQYHQLAIPITDILFQNIATLSILGVIILGCIVLLWWLGKDKKVYNRFIKDGKVITGTLIKCEPKYRMKEEAAKNFYLIATYEFISPITGELIQSERWVDRADLFHKPLPPVGAPVQILYVSDTLTRIG